MPVCECPEGYRLLGDDEVICKTDRHSDSLGKWWGPTGYAGKTVAEARARYLANTGIQHLHYCRAIEPDEVLPPVDQEEFWSGEWEDAE